MISQPPELLFLVKHIVQPANYTLQSFAKSTSSTFETQANKSCHYQRVKLQTFASKWLSLRIVDVT